MIILASERETERSESRCDPHILVVKPLIDQHMHLAIYHVIQEKPSQNIELTILYSLSCSRSMELADICVSKKKREPWMHTPQLLLGGRSFSYKFFFKKNIQMCEIHIIMQH